MYFYIMTVLLLFLKLINELVEGKDYITPPPIQRQQPEGGVTIIRNGKAVQDYSKTPPKHQEPALTKEEIKKMEKMKKEQEKAE